MHLELKDDRKRQEEDMPKYIVKEHSILYKEVEADSPEEAEEIALGEPVHQAESYVEVEEGELL